MIGVLPSSRRRGGKRRSAAFTLLELLICMAIIGAMAALAMPAYSEYVDRTRVAIAIGDIAEISYKIYLYRQETGTLPADLNAGGIDNRFDPWGRTYVYVNLQSVGISMARKNKNLVPINSDYDLYSFGKDRNSRIPLTAAASRDDVLRASDGKFIGLASRFDP